MFFRIAGLILVVFGCMIVNKALGFGDNTVGTIIAVCTYLMLTSRE